MDLQRYPRLIYCSSGRPDDILGDLALSSPEVTIGRPAPDSEAPLVRLDLRSIGRGCHARIVADGDGYVLECLSKRGVQLYERTLWAGEQARLEVVDYFSLPAQRLDSEPHYKFLFCRSVKSMNVYGAPIWPSRIRQHMVVYEQPIKLTPSEDVIFRTLYANRDRRCTYAELIAVMVEGKDKVSPDHSDRKDSLRQQLLSLRRKIRGRGATNDEDEHEQPAPKRQAENDEDARVHCFLDVKWGEYAQLRLEDVIGSLAAHAGDHDTPREVI